mgnify:CR=1 FL=1
MLFRSTSYRSPGGFGVRLDAATAGVGSAQLIKGANSATVGMDAEGSVSSAVNIETKKATDEPINRVSMAWFSDSRVQPAFDFGRRFGSESITGRWLMAWRRQHLTQRNEDDLRAALAWGVGPRTAALPPWACRRGACRCWPPRSSPPS